MIALITRSSENDTLRQKGLSPSEDTVFANSRNVIQWMSLLPALDHEIRNSLDEISQSIGPDVSLKKALIDSGLLGKLQERLGTDLFQKLLNMVRDKNRNTFLAGAISWASGLREKHPEASREILGMISRDPGVPKSLQEKAQLAGGSGPEQWLRDTVHQTSLGGVAPLVVGGLVGQISETLLLTRLGPVAGASKWLGAAAKATGFLSETASYTIGRHYLSGAGTSLLEDFRNCGLSFIAFGAAGRVANLAVSRLGLEAALAGEVMKQGAMFTALYGMEVLEKGEGNIANAFSSLVNMQVASGAMRLGPIARIHTELGLRRQVFRRSQEMQARDLESGFALRPHGLALETGALGFASVREIERSPALENGQAKPEPIMNEGNGVGSGGSGRPKASVDKPGIVESENPAALPRPWEFPKLPRSLADLARGAAAGNRTKFRTLVKLTADGILEESGRAAISSLAFVARCGQDKIVSLTRKTLFSLEIPKELATQARNLSEREPIKSKVIEALTILNSYGNADAYLLLKEMYENGVPQLTGKEAADGAINPEPITNDHGGSLAQSALRAAAKGDLQDFNRLVQLTKEGILEEYGRAAIIFLDFVARRGFWEKIALSAHDNLFSLKIPKGLATQARNLSGPIRSEVIRGLKILDSHRNVDANFLLEKMHEEENGVPQLTGKEAADGAINPEPITNGHGGSEDVEARPIETPVEGITNSLEDSAINEGKNTEKAGSSEGPEALVVDAEDKDLTKLNDSVIVVPKSAVDVMNGRATKAKSDLLFQPSVKEDTSLSELRGKLSDALSRNPNDPNVSEIWRDIAHRFTELGDLRGKAIRLALQLQILRKLEGQRPSTKNTRSIKNAQDNIAKLNRQISRIIKEKYGLDAAYSLDLARGFGLHLYGSPPPYHLAEDSFHNFLAAGGDFSDLYVSHQSEWLLSERNLAYLPQIKSLTISHPPEDNLVREHLPALLQYSGLPNLQALKFSGGLGDKEAVVIAQGNISRGLTSLTLAEGKVTVYGLRAILRSSNYPRLDSLGFERNKINAYGLQAIAEIQGRNWKHINLERNPLGPMGGTIINDSKEVFAGLRSLNLAGTQLDSEGVRLIFYNRWPYLEFLDLRDNELSLDELKNMSERQRGSRFPRLKYFPITGRATR